MKRLNTRLVDRKEHFQDLLKRVLEQHWTNIGLRAKMGIMVEVGLISLISIFLLLAVSASRQSNDQILNERIMLARLSAANLDSSLRQIQSVLTILGERDVIQDPAADPVQRQDALDNAFRQISMSSSGIWMLDSSASLIASSVSTTSPQVKLADLRDAVVAIGVTSEPRLVMLPGDPAPSTIILSINDPLGKPYTTRDDKATGVAVATLVVLLDLDGSEFSAVRNAIDQGCLSNPGETCTLDVIDSSGQILISSHPTRVGVGHRTDQDWSRFFNEGKPNVETCLGCAEGGTNESSDEVIAFAPLTQAPWGVVVRQKASELMAPVNRLLMQTLFLGAVTVIGALFLVWVTTSSVIRPVQMLKEASERIAKGDLSTPLEIPSQSWIYGRARRNDEIGDLAQSFSAMRKQLKRSMDEINALNYELDQRVRERTQAAMNAQLEAQAARDDLRAIIDALSDELIVVNVEDNTIQLANQSVLDQHNSLGELVGQPCIQVCHRGEPCENPDCDCPLPLVVKTGNSVRVTHQQDCQILGKKIYKEISASPLRDVNGRINRIVELTRDVTEGKELAESLVRRNQQLSILNAVATTVNQSLNLEDILSRSLDSVLKLTVVDVGAIFLQEDLQGMLKLMAYRGLSEDAAKYAAEMGMLDGSCGGVLDHGQIVIVPDLSRYHYWRSRSLRNENLKTLVHIPLNSKGSVLGSMCVGTHHPRIFNEEEQKLLSAIGSQIAVAIENARLYSEVQMKERMRGELFMKAINAQEDERKRIARELHDDTSQSLAALLFAVEESLEMEENPEIRERLDGMNDLVQRMLDGVHKLIFDLRPSMLDHLGLVPAIRWFAESRLESKGVRVSIQADSLQDRLAAEVETALFRIAQEAIMNIARHAAARNTWIKLSAISPDVMMEIEDDGVGFDFSELGLEPDSLRGMGLMGMQERLELLGGDLVIQSAHGSGTRLVISIPVQIESVAYA